MISGTPARVRGMLLEALFGANACVVWSLTIGESMLIYLFCSIDLASNVNSDTIDDMFSAALPSCRNTALIANH